MENPIKMDDLGVPGYLYFRKPPYLEISGISTTLYVSVCLRQFRHPWQETPDAEAGNGFACAVSTPINSSRVTAVLNAD